MMARDTAGYSLLELLVALALTAVIATMMVSVTTQLHPLRRIQAKYDAQEIADDLTYIIANDLKGALPLPLLQDEARRAFVGSETQIHFVSIVKTGFRARGLREVTYFVKSNRTDRKGSSVGSWSGDLVHLGHRLTRKLMTCSNQFNP